MARRDMVRPGMEYWVWFDLVRRGMARFGMDYEAWRGAVWYDEVGYGF